MLRFLMNRCENTNRVDKVVDQATKQENSSKLPESCSSTKRKFSYGTINSHPEEPLDSIESLIEKKFKLKQMYENYKNCNWEEVLQLLQETYYLQRSDLNGKMRVSTVLEEWPFLFEEDGMLLHFHHLVGFEICNKFQSNFKTKSRRVLDFIAGQNSNPDDVSEVTLLHFLEAVTKSLKEDLAYIVIECDSEISKKEAEVLKNLPQTPCIIACGNIRDTESFMLSVDGTIVNESCCNFMDIFMMMFASYYIFNIAYPEEACSTLEFFQRCYFGINPDRGNKRKKNKGKSKVHPKLLTFLDEMSHFEWM